MKADRNTLQLNSSYFVRDRAKFYIREKHENHNDEESKPMPPAET